MKLADIMENVSVTDIVNIMSELGSDAPKNLDITPLYFQTICHNEPHTGSHKLAYHTDTKQFHCYTECSCNYSLIDLIKKVLKVEFEEAFSWLCGILNISSIHKLQYGFTQQKLDHSFLNKFRSYKPFEEEHLLEHNSEILKHYYDLYHISWIKEGISKSVMKDFNIKFDIENNRIIIPHYDYKNRLVGIKCRNLHEELVEKGLKYVPIKRRGIQYNYQTSLNLYGLNFNIEAIKKYKHVIIFESEKAVMQHRSFYGASSVAVAISGSAISPFQIDLLLRLGVETVDIALDKEFVTLMSKEDRLYRTKIFSKFVVRLKQYFTVGIVYDQLELLSLKDSPTDKGKNIFEQLYRNKIIC